jgi:hypothetical protein
LGLTPAYGDTVTPNASFQSNLPYPTIKDVRDDCKEALKLAETDMSAFLHTSCARQLNGIYNGFYQIIARVQPLANDPGDPCFPTKERLHNKLTNIICLPNSDFSKDKPIELQLAKDLVAYIDTTHLKTNISAGHASKEYPVFDIGVMFTEMYKCNRQSEGGT